MIRQIVVLTSLLALAACGESDRSAQTAAESVPSPAVDAETPISGVVVANFDRSVRPQDDLYRFINGKWLETTEIPDDKSDYGAFGILQDTVEKNLRVIAEETAAAGAPEGSDKQLIGDFYASFMDHERVEELGMAPLVDELAVIDAISSRKALVDYFGRAQRLGILNPIRATIMPDAKDPEFYTVWVDQSGLAMPDRDYYLEDDERFVEMRDKYQAYMALLLAMAGRENSDQVAEDLMKLETRLAKASWAQVDLRDVDKVYNPFDVAGANKITPNLDWKQWLAATGIRKHDHMVVGQPSFFEELSRALGDVPLDTWKDYLSLRLIDGFAPYLGDAFVQAHFDFYGRTISGTPQIRPRWKRGLEETEGAIGDLLGKAYVEKHFPPEAKRRMDELVANLLTAFGRSIDHLDWMGPDTRRQAHEKLDNFTVKIGYPEKWKEYPGLKIHRDDLFGNVVRAREVAHNREVKKLGSPVDKTEWFMSPQTVNAYYNPLANEIVFPAAILQPPFFDMYADDAVNYGGIGSVIGHEISHGFDDQGRKFDGKGMLRDWWSDEDNTRFKALADRLVAQYSAYSPLPELHVNGELTLGENIGDLSGVEVSYKAYEIALDGKPAPVLDEFTGPQRFFIGWGQVWARKYRDDDLRRRLLTDPHSPSEYRVNGIVRNLPAFIQAFEVGEGDALYLAPEDQVKIW
jgi:predicted metalloendopeptidase